MRRTRRRSASASASAQTTAAPAVIGPRRRARDAAVARLASARRSPSQPQPLAGLQGVGVDVGFSASSVAIETPVLTAISAQRVARLDDVELRRPPVLCRAEPACPSTQARGRRRRVVRAQAVRATIRYVATATAARRDRRQEARAIPSHHRAPIIQAVRAVAGASVSRPDPGELKRPDPRPARAAAPPRARRGRPGSPPACSWASTIPREADDQPAGRPGRERRRQVLELGRPARRRPAAGTARSASARAATRAARGGRADDRADVGEPRAADARRAELGDESRRAGR